VKPKNIQEAAEEIDRLRAERDAAIQRTEALERQGGIDTNDLYGDLLGAMHGEPEYRESIRYDGDGSRAEILIRGIVRIRQQRDAAVQRAEAAEFDADRRLGEARYWKGRADGAGKQRDALAEALEQIDDGDGCDTRPYADCCDQKCRDIARAALAKLEGK
jgi:hypothetical protein